MYMQGMTGTDHGDRRTRIFYIFYLFDSWSNWFTVDILLVFQFQATINNIGFLTRY